MRLPAGNYVEHYLRYAERTVEDYSNDEIEGALDESEKTLAGRFTLVRSKGKKDGKFVFAKKGKKKSRFRGNDAIRNMAKSMGLIDAKVFQQSS